jgi:ribosomal protein S18 acetylase RimI-like enzyme
MATAPAINHELRISPLEEADLAALEALFDEQCAEWLSLLGWDYTQPSRLIREVVRQRELSGFVVTSGQETVGFSYFIIEPARCSIGDIYVSKAWRGRGADALMVAAILDRIDRLARARRVESQCVTVEAAGASHIFESRGFARLDRNYMICELAGSNYDEPESHLSRPEGRLAGVRIRAWEDHDFAQAARVVHRSYRGGPDSLINSQYASEDGCAELVSILTDHIWCGDFLPRVSRVTARRQSGSLAGVLIASRLAPGVGHISQISVHPAWQNLGIGRMMISEALYEFKTRGYRSVSLAVTTANRAALHLYESCGFQTAHTFPVFYRQNR